MKELMTKISAETRFKTKHGGCCGWLSWYLVVLFDDVLSRQRVVLQIAGQVEHVLGQLLLQVVVVLQDGLQLRGRLTLVQGQTSAGGGGNNNVLSELCKENKLIAEPRRQNAAKRTFCFAGLWVLQTQAGEDS